MSSAPSVEAGYFSPISVTECQPNQRAPFFALTTGASRVWSSMEIFKRWLLYLKWMVRKERRVMLLVQSCSFFVLFTSIFYVFLHARTRMGPSDPWDPYWPVPAYTGIPYPQLQVWSRTGTGTGHLNLPHGYPVSITTLWHVHVDSQWMPCPSCQDNVEQVVDPFLCPYSWLQHR